MTDTEFKEELRAAVTGAVTDVEVLSEINKYLEKGLFWEVAKSVGCYYNLPGISQQVIAACREIVDKVREYQGDRARTSAAETTVVFGTSGWRGIIGEDFTTLNVAKVVRGIIEMMRTEKFLTINKYSTFSEVQEHGIVVFRDKPVYGG